MSLYCVKGREVLMDLQRSDWLPPHDEEGIRTILDEVREIHQKLETLIQKYQDQGIPDQLKIYLAFLHQSLGRNHRYLNSYTHHRLQKLREIRWEVGAVLPERVTQDTLSAHERSFFAQYNSLVTDMNEAMGFDLSADLEPPVDLLIEIRVLKDCGKVMTDSGPVSLDQGSIHFLRRAQVESFIRQGRVEHIVRSSSC